MRSRQEIETSTKMYDQLSLEVLLDIRDLLLPKVEPELTVEASQTNTIIETAIKIKPGNMLIPDESADVGIFLMNHPQSQMQVKEKPVRKKRKIKRKYTRKNKKKESV